MAGSRAERGADPLRRVAGVIVVAFILTAVGARARAATLGWEFTVGAITVAGPPGASPLSADRRGEIVSALQALPRALASRRLNVLVGSGVPCLSDGLPAGDVWWDADARRIRLCDGAPADLARQIVLAALYAFDADQGRDWSGSPAWRLLAGWRASPLSGWRTFAENTAPGAHAGTGMGAAPAAVERALSSPRWDLVTFAAAVLLERDTGDHRLACRLVSHAAFLRARLEAADAEKSADPGGPAMAALARPCATFEAWAALESLEDVELVLAAPSNAMVGSMFGHLFLRLRYRSPTGEIPAELGRTVAFLADNDTPFRDDPGYAIKGIVGRYAATLHERPFLSTYREYVVIEGRDLRRWRLRLAPEQRRRLAERIWTLRQAGSYRYYFFSRNCATLLVDLINGALDGNPEVRVPGLVAAPPSSILERFEAARTAAGEALAEHVPEPILAFEHQARLAGESRRGLEAVLLENAPSGQARPLAVAFEQTHSPDPTVRARAYAELRGLLGAVGPRGRPHVHRYLRDSALLESHLSTVANLEEEERAFASRRVRLRAAVERLTVLLRSEMPPGSAEGGAIAEITEDDPQRRLLGYQRLAAAMPALQASDPQRATWARRLVLLQSEVRYDVGRMKAVPGLRDTLLFVDGALPLDEQPYMTGTDAATAAEAAAPPVSAAEVSSLLVPPTVTRVAEPLRALQRSKEALFAAGQVTTSADTAAGDPAKSEADLVARAYAGALSRSGIDQLAVLAAVSGTAGGPAPSSHRAGLLLAGALYDERLGDRRRFGFPSHTAFTVARSATLVAWGGGGAPHVALHDSRLFGYRTLRPSLPEGGGGSPGVGWELSLDVRGHRAQGIAAAIAAGWGMLLRIWDRDELAEHVLLTFGVAYESIFPSAMPAGIGHPQLVMAPVGLELRRRVGPSDSHRSHLAARIFARPQWIPLGASTKGGLDVGSRAECHLALRPQVRGGAHDPALLLALDVMHTWWGVFGAGGATHALVSLGVELR